MDRIIACKKVGHRKGRVIINYPLNGGTAYSFEGAIGMYSDTGEYLYLNDPPNYTNMVDLPEKERMSAHIKSSLLAMIRRFAFHPDLEICIVPFSSNANMRVEMKEVYGEDYCFVGRSKMDLLARKISELRVEGAMNLGDCYRRIHHQVNTSSDENFRYYFINIIPSVATFCTFSHFEPDMPFEPEYLSEFYLGPGDVPEGNSRVMHQYYSLATGQYDWEQLFQMITYFPSIEPIIRSERYGGTGYYLPGGIVDEHSLGYATLGLAALSRENNIKSFHIESGNTVYSMMSTALQNSLGIDEVDLGKIWHKVFTSDQFLAAINNVACAILDDLRIP